MALIHINRDSENIGKFNDQDVADGLKSGRFLPTDLAWREPMTSWAPLSTFTDLPPPEEITEPIPQASTTAPTKSGGRIVISECFSSGWENFQKNMGFLILATFVFLLVSVSLNFVSELAQRVVQMFMTPGGSEEQMLKIVALVVGLFFTVLTSIISWILSAGFLWMFIKNSRGKTEFGDLFAGFSSGVWLQLLVAFLVWTGALVVWFGAFIVIAGLSSPLFSLFEKGIFHASDVGTSTYILTLALIFIIPVVYFAVGLGFALPLILDRRIGWLEGMRTAISTVHRQWFPVALLVLICALLGISGVFFCCVGILFTMPLGYAICAECYRQLFGDPQESSEN